MPFTTLEEIIACVEGKTQGKSTRSLSGRQPEDKKPSVKGTPLMETSQAPDLTMTHADSLHYQPTQGRGNFVYKILVLEHQMPSRTKMIFDIDECFTARELTPVLNRRSTSGSTWGRVVDQLEWGGEHTRIQHLQKWCSHNASTQKF